MYYCATQGRYSVSMQSNEVGAHFAHQPADLGSLRHFARFTDTNATLVTGRNHWYHVMPAKLAIESGAAQSGHPLPWRSKQDPRTATEPVDPT